jgi:succinylarginine dihydrolase
MNSNQNHHSGTFSEAREVNYDGLVGPTHNYSGLAYGNVAAMDHRLTMSHPLQAVLQGLQKMKVVADMDVAQAILPPHERPHVKTLRELGFRGTDREIIAAAAKKAPELLAACYSSSSMWTANAATVSPSADTADNRVHFTPANLTSHLHRSIEAEFTGRVLKRLFPDEALFAHHTPLPPALQLCDEGAANHARICRSHGKPGIEIFVYGRRAFVSDDQGPSRFPARQTLEASEAIARLHMLQEERTLFLRQSSSAIDAGVFHNDVISVANEKVFLYHSLAFQNTSAAIQQLSVQAEETGIPLWLIEVTTDRVSLDEAVGSYLFNSQLVTRQNGSMCLIAPIECAELHAVRTLLERIVSQPNPIEEVVYVDLRESMKNGGGPACLRLRVVLTPQELEQCHQGVLFSEKLFDDLLGWANRHYRDRLHAEDLVDPSLLEESRACLDELTQILRLGSIYDFQRIGS